ncbi:MAG TPA: putative Ig domain-containing protein [Steroidobacteraceae bacterium]|nr:putative Ig domain-containing protein [Steroidobacteraceae bacterium]
MIEGSPPLTAKAGTPYVYAPLATDADQNDTLAFTITGLPVWAAFDTTTGALSGTPRDGDVGTSDDIEITVSDGKDEDSIGPFRIQIAARASTPPPTNNAPTITGTPAATVVAGSAYTFTPKGADKDGDALTYAITNRPRWATFNTSTGQLSGTPAATNVGTSSNITLSVSDGKVSASLPSFTIQVQAPPNSGPAISGSPATSVQAGTAYSFQPTATDSNGDALAWTIQNKPSWATFSNTTGKLSGTPTAANAGAFANIRITVSDSKVSASLPVFSINVTTVPNRAPTISGTPGTTASVGSPYSFTPTGADADKDTLTYSIQNKPSWAAFSTASGQLSGSPTAAGSFSNVTISVSDGKASASLAAFSITVSGAATTNRAPAISGSPATSVTAGSAYSFTPGVSDADGDTLTFSIANKPDWATFSTSNGKLSGTPAAGDAGTEANIIISVTDGKATVSLAAFSITVSGGAVVTGSATVNWTPPTQNTDGSSLTNLAGYRIHYGTSSSSLSQVVTVAGTGLTSYTIDDLAAGTWYFSVGAYSSSGAESAGSNIASKTIQ